jgi:hypothetical protein
MEEKMNKIDEIETRLVGQWLKDQLSKYWMLSLWAVAGALLITLGCICESYTVLGHHLLLIIAGATIGIGVYREAAK